MYASHRMFLHETPHNSNATRRRKYFDVKRQPQCKLSSKIVTFVFIITSLYFIPMMKTCLKIESHAVEMLLNKSFSGNTLQKNRLDSEKKSHSFSQYFNILIIVYLTSN